MLFFKLIFRDKSGFSVKAFPNSGIFRVKCKDVLDSTTSLFYQRVSSKALKLVFVSSWESGGHQGFLANSLRNLAFVWK